MYKYVYNYDAFKNIILYTLKKLQTTNTYTYVYSFKQKYVHQKRSMCCMFVLM